MRTPQEALSSLRRGNERFATGHVREQENPIGRRAALAAGQAPSAVILSCSDSRVPPELIFDQHLGDLFVVRVAGHVIGLAQIGSIEFAIDQLGSRLVVVLGHSRCGAVAATLDSLAGPTELTPGLDALVGAIRPAVEPVIDPVTPDEPRDELLARAVRAHVVASTQQLHVISSLLDARVRCDELLIIGAEYCLETGRVTFLDPP